MIIGLISDTHDNIPNIKKALEIFKKKNVELIIHAGDICAPATIQYFSGFKTKFVRGNVDCDIDMMKERVKEIGGEFYTEYGIFELDGKKFALYHGMNEVVLNAFIKGNKYDYVIRGHTHRPVDIMVGKTRVINPGAHYPVPEQEPHTVAILDTKKNTVEFVEIK